MIGFSLFVVYYGALMFLLGSWWETAHPSTYSHASAISAVNCVKREWTSNGWRMAKRIFRSRADQPRDKRGRFCS